MDRKQIKENHASKINPSGSQSAKKSKSRPNQLSFESEMAATIEHQRSVLHKFGKNPDGPADRNLFMNYYSQNFNYLDQSRSGRERKEPWGMKDSEILQ